MSVKTRAERIKGPLSAGERLKFACLARFHIFPAVNPTVTYASYAQIGAVLGVSAKTIRNILTEYLAQTAVEFYPHVISSKRKSK